MAPSAPTPPPRPRNSNESHERHSSSSSTGSNSNSGSNGGAMRGLSNLFRPLRSPSSSSNGQTGNSPSAAGPPTPPARPGLTNGAGGGDSRDSRHDSWLPPVAEGPERSGAVGLGGGANGQGGATQQGAGANGEMTDSALEEALRASRDEAEYYRAQAASSKAEEDRLFQIAMDASAYSAEQDVLRHARLEDERLAEEKALQDALAQSARTLSKGKGREGESEEERHEREMFEMAKALSLSEAARSRARTSAQEFERLSRPSATDVARTSAQEFERLSRPSATEVARTSAQEFERLSRPSGSQEEYDWSESAGRQNSSTVVTERQDSFPARRGQPHVLFSIVDSPPLTASPPLASPPLGSSSTSDLTASPSTLPLSSREDSRDRRTSTFIINNPDPDPRDATPPPPAYVPPPPRVVDPDAVILGPGRPLPAPSNTRPSTSSYSSYSATQGSSSSSAYSVTDGESNDGDDGRDPFDERFAAVVDTRLDSGEEAGGKAGAEGYESTPTSVGEETDVASLHAETSVRSPLGSNAGGSAGSSHPPSVAAPSSTDHGSGPPSSPTTSISTAPTHAPLHTYRASPTFGGLVDSASANALADESVTAGVRFGFVPYRQRKMHPPLAYEGGFPDVAQLSRIAGPQAGSAVAGTSQAKDQSASEHVSFAIEAEGWQDLLKYLMWHGNSYIEAAPADLAKEKSGRGLECAITIEFFRSFQTNLLRVRCRMDLLAPAQAHDPHAEDLVATSYPSYEVSCPAITVRLPKRSLLPLSLSALATRLSEAHSISRQQAKALQKYHPTERALRDLAKAVDFFKSLNGEEIHDDAEVEADENNMLARIKGRMKWRKKAPGVVKGGADGTGDGRALEGNLTLPDGAVMITPFRIDDM